MNRLVITLMVAMMLLIAGCASSGDATTAAASASDNGALPEIAAYDEPEIPALDAPATE